MVRREFKQVNCSSAAIVIGRYRRLHRSPKLPSVALWLTSDMRWCLNISRHYLAELHVRTQTFNSLDFIPRAPSYCLCYVSMWSQLCHVAPPARFTPPPPPHWNPVSTDSMSECIWLWQCPTVLFMCVWNCLSQHCLERKYWSSRLTCVKSLKQEISGVLHIAPFILWTKRHCGDI